MKILLAIALACFGTASAFANQIWCSDQGDFSNQLPDSSYTYRIESSNSRDVYMPLTDRLFASVESKEGNVLSITVGKSGGPYATWSPIASTFSDNEVTLMINRNALATEMFYDSSSFPKKKITESNEKFFNRLKDYFKKGNSKPLIDAFNKKYGELLIIHCKYVK